MRAGLLVWLVRLCVMVFADCLEGLSFACVMIVLV